jgi:hypothetical protein
LLASSSAVRSSASSFTSVAFRFSSNCLTLDAPTRIADTAGRVSSQANETCAGDAPRFVPIDRNTSIRSNARSRS